MEQASPICTTLPAFKGPSRTSSPHPIKYSITQHYNHSAHQAALKPTEPSSSVEQNTPPELGLHLKNLLLKHNINSELLLSTQLILFEQANMEQRARLLELWQISLPILETSSPLKESQQCPPVSPDNDSACDGFQSSFMVVEPCDDMMMDEPDSESYDILCAEPYVVTGYESLKQRVSDSSAIQSISSNSLNLAAVQAAANDRYELLINPRSMRENWPAQPRLNEQQHSDLEMKMENYYPGRPHWPEDQRIYSVEL